MMPTLMGAYDPSSRLYVNSWVAQKMLPRWQLALHRAFFLRTGGLVPLALELEPWADVLSLGL